MGQKKEKRSVMEELESLAPRLARLKEQESRVEIPSGYFDQLSDDLFLRIREDADRARSQSDRVAFWGRFRDHLLEVWQRPAYATALAGLAILLVGIAIFNNPGPVGELTDINLSDEDITEYINYHIDDFDLNLLAEEAAGDLEEGDFIFEEDSLPDLLPDRYFDQLLDEIDLEELL